MSDINVFKSLVKENNAFLKSYNFFLVVWLLIETFKDPIPLFE